MILWNGCVRMMAEVNVGDSVKAKYAMAAWMESCELDDRLDEHTCDTERAFIFIGREFLYKWVTSTCGNALLTRSPASGCIYRRSFVRSSRSSRRELRVESPWILLTDPILAGI
jgi:hypothetical protein